MAKVAFILLLLLSSASQLGSARNCTDGVTYCGYYLLGMDNYQKSIENALSRASQPANNQTRVANSLFNCYGTEGAIWFNRYCQNGCLTGAADKNDYCRGATVSVAAACPSSVLVTSSSTAPSVASTTAANIQPCDCPRKTPVGGIVGGVVGGVAGTAAAGLGLFFWYRRRKNGELQASRQEHRSMYHRPAVAPENDFCDMQASDRGPGLMHEVAANVRHELH
ncbi:hypothetical protein QQS21_002296 [Conoideocrella luteorostrata]|uniref:Uncharacterized protein n=1 Tax=Conoideocrella luteorostrata TaxID=1105319 RepID=A0AAJ0G1G9_9HYPO|nr:hypothetical protein QQS21_002296 [Conoideocrella luteorostrata]